MQLYEADVQLFLATVQAFVDVLPPCPKRKSNAAQKDESTEAKNRLERDNFIRILRIDMTEVSGDSTKDRMMCDVPDGDAFEKAREALEDLLLMMNERVDDGIPKEDSNDPPPNFAKLCALKALLQPHNSIPTTEASITLPHTISTWISWPREGTEPAHYRRITKTVKQFKETMRDIHMANSYLESTQVEIKQPYYHSHLSQEDTSYKKRALDDIQQAHRLCELAKSLVKVFKKAPVPCQLNHSAHIHLSGFEKDEIDMFISICDEPEFRKWQIVHWANSGSLKSPDLQHNPMSSFCSLLKTSLKNRSRLRMQLQRDGCWSSQKRETSDRFIKLNVPKKKLSNWLRPGKDGETVTTGLYKLTNKKKLYLALKIARSLLCLLGSPLIRSPLTSQRIFIDETADETSYDLNIKPYILEELNRCLHEEESQKSAGAQSAMLYLGVLFWEIFIGEEVEVLEDDKEDYEAEDENGIQTLFNALTRAEVNKRESDFTDRSCLDLIANCLNLYPDAEVVDAEFRTNFYESIVEPLITSFSAYSFPNKAEIAVKNKSASKPTSLNRDFNARQNIDNEIRFQKGGLFDTYDQTDDQKRTQTDNNTKDFVSRMSRFMANYILPLPDDPVEEITSDSDPLKRNIRIAVLDTGFCVDSRDELVSEGEERIVQKRNFFSTDEDDHIDTYSHGTHVIRLLLRFAPNAKIILAKISKSKHEVAKSHQIVEALNWVSSDERKADIIVLSFGLDPTSGMKESIKRLVEAGKIIFAAASNSGGNQTRAFPANQDGVFCIHVSDGLGNKVGINPTPVSDDNFSTLGNAIDSKWKGDEVYINGSSFAAPVAAAIAANALEFIRHHLTAAGDRPMEFYTPKVMRDLFQCLSDRIDGYDYVKPWKRYLWDNKTNIEEICTALRALERYGAKWWIQRTSETSFPGFGKPRCDPEDGTD
ncbi:hypothetical protein TGAM01_v210298 [Trichoderma gamsii]|uniref:Uncharacterized protein n=1 Tax=Trichoderma gamsii TaxID=398673 RepID=A0A2P4Z914_9HYPO|nr:hypothetical protein TGAM01_v210298 [Trichoderma gamsii]PON20790.1 hypothetical protein TGAM01_v210298 [Trichoderma gamsii]